MRRPPGGLTRGLTQRQRLGAIVLAVLAACFITLDVGGSSLNSAHSGVRGALGSLYRGTDSVLGPVRRFVQGVPSAGSNEQRIHALQHENALLAKQVADAQADKNTAARLRTLQLAANNGRYRMVPARVVAISPAAGFDWTVTIDTGTSDGIRTGQTVTDGYGLVGRVLRADPSTAVVLLAVDPGSGVGVRDLRSGQIGVVTGSGAAGMTFRPLDPTTRVRVGDRLSTGPSRSSSYVAGVAVGTVRAVHVSAAGAIVASVNPTVSPTGLDLLSVILVGGRTDTRAPVGPSAPLAGGR